MSKKLRVAQSGSSILFVIVGILLLVGLVGGVYIVRQRGEQARRDSAIAAVEQQTPTDDSKSTSNSDENPNVSTADQGADAQSLPVTGPDLEMVQAVGAGMLTVFGLIYLKSRRSVIVYL